MVNLTPDVVDMARPGLETRAQPRVDGGAPGEPMQAVPARRRGSTATTRGLREESHLSAR